MKKYSLLLLAGGVGKRMKAQRPKQLMLLGGKPMILHSLYAVENIPEISEIIVTCPDNFLSQMQEILDLHKIKKTLRCVVGGATRQESVWKGLQAAHEDHILLHEAARPMVCAEDFKSLIHSDSNNVIIGLSLPFSILAFEGDSATGSLDRSKLINVQLPHKYLKSDLMEAHRTAQERKREYTEDAAMLLDINKPVKICQGRPENIKITTQMDYICAQCILSGTSDE